MQLPPAGALLLLIVLAACLLVPPCALADETRLPAAATTRIAAGRPVPARLSNFDLQTAWLPEVAAVQIYDFEHVSDDAKDPQRDDSKPIDREKDFPLRPYGDDSWVPVYRVRTLRGRDAERFVSLYRQLDFGGLGLFCHHPAYAVRCFDAAGRMTLETSICWGCNNLFLRASGGYAWTSFHSGNAEARALLEFCRHSMTDPAARAPGADGADRIMLADAPPYVPDDLDRWKEDDGEQTDARLATLRGYSALRELSIFSGQISDDGLATLDTLTGLRSLSLRAPQITDAGLAHLRGLRRLVELELKCDHLNPQGLKIVGTLASLQSLGIETPVTDQALAELAKLTDLQQLSLQGPGITDAGLASLAKLTKLETLSLEQTGVHGPGLSAFYGSPKLTTLYLKRSALTDDGLAAIAELPALECLYLEGVQSITDAGMARLIACPKLYRINLEGTAIGDAGLRHVAKNPNIAYLEIKRSGVTDASIDTLIAIPKLKAVWIGDTKITDAGKARLHKSRPEVTVQN